MTYEQNLIDRITYHLSSGGLFNPELADHIAVRNLLMECREALAQSDSKDKEQAKTDSFVRQLDEALAQQEPWEKFCDSNCVWTDHHPDCKLAQIEPVAWLHRFIEGGISIGLKPADLERHPERWEPLYTEPKPCPTCEALARTVMLDQTSHDTTPPQRKPLTDEEIYKASTEARMQEHYMGFHSGFIRFARAIEAAHGIKGEA